MTDNEVNKIIAEFMGWKYHPDHSPSPVFTHKKYSDKYEYENFFNYTQSLDALVPVWEKIYKITEKANFDLTNSIDVALINKDKPSILAAHATAKAIKETEEHNGRV